MHASIPAAGRTLPVQRQDAAVRPFDNPEVILTNFKSRFTGVSATIANLAGHHERGFRVVILGRPLPVATPRIGWWRLARFLWRRPAGRDVRIWHARRGAEMLTGWVLKHLFRAPLKLVYTEVALRRHCAVHRALLGSMDAVISTTEEAASYLARCDSVVPHGVDTSLFTPPQDKRLCWQQSGLPGRYGIGIFGRVRPEKGTDLFVKAMCRVLPRYPDFAAVIAGRWKRKDKAFQRSLAKGLADAGIEDRVHWLGEVPAAQRHLWFQRISLCVAPPRYEGFGLTPLEAMSCGAAVVATRTGVFPTLIEDGKAGYVVDVDDLDALVARIEQCLQDPEALLRMGRNGRDHVARWCDVSREAEGVERVYQRIFDGEL